MTRDEAMQLAEQAGIEKWWNQANADQRSYEDALVRLVTMTAKTEREACREVLEECIRTQAHLACNAREALSEASARICKRGET